MPEALPNNIGEENPPEDDLIRFLAVGRVQEDHVVMAIDKTNPEFKQYKTIVKRMSPVRLKKMKPNDRFKLEDPEKGYDVHVMVDSVDEEPDMLLVFFAFLSNKFGQAHSPQRLFEDFKNSFYKCNEIGQLSTAKSGGPVHKNSQKVFSSLRVKYGRNKLKDTMRLADEVQELMSDNIEKVVSNIGHLNEIEDKAENLERHGDKFLKNAKHMKRRMCWRYIKTTLLIILVILAVTCVVFGPTIMGWIN